MPARRRRHTKRKRAPVHPDADAFKTLADRVRRIELFLAFMLGVRAGEWIGLWR